MAEKKTAIDQGRAASDTRRQQDFLKEADGIIAACNSLAGEHKEVLDQLTASLSLKEGHKQAYQEGIDRGDEAAMKKSLASIRQVNSDIEALQGRLSALPQKIDRLRDRHTILCNNARDLRPEAQAALDQARADFESVVQLISRCVHGVLSEINRVADAMQSSNFTK